MRHGKYNAARVEYDGHKFDSKAELRRYNELVLLRQAREIVDLQVHPVFELQGKFTDRNGKTHRAIRYEADFSYVDHGVFVVEDVKGKRTPVFNIKEKLFLMRYPQADFRVIKAR